MEAARRCRAVFAPRPGTAVLVGWDPAPKISPTQQKLGASPEHCPADGDRSAHPPYSRQERSRTRSHPQGCGVSPVALAVAVGSPVSRVGVTDGCAQAWEGRGRCKPCAGMEGEMQTPTQALW